MLLLKYNNMKKSIENQQTMETQMFEKTTKTNSKAFLTLRGFKQVDYDQFEEKENEKVAAVAR